MSRNRRLLYAPAAALVVLLSLPVACNRQKSQRFVPAAATTPVPTLNAPAAADASALPPGHPTAGDELAEFNTEAYDRIDENPFLETRHNPLSTFSIDVDTASYANVRRFLCSDGDFNVGITDQGSLTRLIEDEAKSGVFLSVFGFGTGNLKDATMEKLADRGNGNYAYIDTLNEARKVLVEQLGGTLVTIAKDVKLQLEFNPRQVAAYRLIGYENRLLRAEDFNDDKKDAGEIGAGHTVTAFYELVPAGGGEPSIASVDELKYQRVSEPTDVSARDELLTLKLRYKEPEGDGSTSMVTVVTDGGENYAQASQDFRFAAAVAAFGLLLRDSQFKGDLTLPAVHELAEARRGADENGYRAEFIALVEKARSLAANP